MKTFIIVATTLDGFIGKSAGDVSTRWTSKEDAAWFSKRTKEADLCVMGRTTYETFNRPLKDRATLVLTSNPGKFSQDQRRFGTEVTVVDQTTDIQALLSKQKTQVWATSLKIDLLHQLLTQAGAQELAVCGGASVYTQWLKAGLVDEMYLTLEPVFFGQGVKLFTEDVDVGIEVVSERVLNKRGTRVIKLKMRR